MYRDSYQRGMLTVFFSCGSKPLNIWETHTQDGYISRFLDQDIKSMVLEIGGTNVSTTYMVCPKGKEVLGITMPFLVMIVKNLKKYFSFEVTVLDETGARRRFRVSNFQSTTQILPLCTVMPIGLSDGWNQIQFNLAEFTRRAYQKQFVEVQKLKINANIRLRRIYFTERLIPEDQLPPEYKLYFPLSNKEKGKKAKAGTEGEKENIKPSTSLQTTSEPKPGSKASLHSLKKEQAIQEESAGPDVAQQVEAPTATEAAEEVAQAEEAAEVVGPTEEAVAEPAEGQVTEGEIPAEAEETAADIAVPEGAQEGEPAAEEATGEPAGEPTAESVEPAAEATGEPAPEEPVGEPQGEPAAEPEAPPPE